MQQQMAQAQMGANPMGGAEDPDKIFAAEGENLEVIDHWSVLDGVEERLLARAGRVLSLAMQSSSRTVDAFQLQAHAFASPRVKTLLRSYQDTHNSTVSMQHAEEGAESQLAAQPASNALPDAPSQRSAFATGVMGAPLEFHPNPRIYAAADHPQNTLRYSRSYEAENDEYDDDDEPSYEQSKVRHAELQAEAEANYAEDNTDRWNADEERAHAENYRDAIVQEREDREAYTATYYDNGEGDEGHEDRIEQLSAKEQLANNQMAHLNREYEYSSSMRDIDPGLQDELQQENEDRWGYAAPEDEGSDMDLEDSDED
ncbi:hypothetical protein LTR95_017609 [Oleoguttula sp. CCFEE 5521]